MGRTARFVDELHPLPSNCTDRSIMIFLQMSLLAKEKNGCVAVFLRFSARLPQCVGNGPRRRLAAEHVTHVDSRQAVAGDVGEIAV